MTEQNNFVSHSDPWSRDKKCLANTIHAKQVVIQKHDLYVLDFEAIHYDYM